MGYYYSTSHFIYGIEVGHKDGYSWISKPNSAGGVSLKCTIKNTLDKPIKYVMMSFIPYNAVDDAVSCTITRKSKVSVKVTGPIAPNEEKRVLFEDLWYNNTITKASLLVDVQVIYMDNTSENLDQIEQKLKTKFYVPPKPPATPQELRKNLRDTKIRHVLIWILVIGSGIFTLILIGFGAGGAAFAMGIMFVVGIVWLVGAKQDINKLKKALKPYGE